MRVAIVGTSHALTENEERDIRQFCVMVLKEEHADTLISGGASGVDLIAVEVAKGLNIPVTTFEPEVNEWIPINNKIGYKKRNIEIAESCDKLICITIPKRPLAQKCYHHTPPANHTKTAGCWTMNEALKLNKECKLLITPER